MHSKCADHLPSREVLTALHVQGRSHAVLSYLSAYVLSYLSAIGQLIHHVLFMCDQPCTGSEGSYDNLCQVLTGESPSERLSTYRCHGSAKFIGSSMWHVVDVARLAQAAICSTRTLMPVR